MVSLITRNWICVELTILSIWTIMYLPAYMHIIKRANNANIQFEIMGKIRKDILCLLSCKCHICTNSLQMWKYLDVSILLKISQNICDLSDARSPEIRAYEIRHAFWKWLFLFSVYFFVIFCWRISEILFW